MPKKSKKIKKSITFKKLNQLYSSHKKNIFSKIPLLIVFLCGGILGYLITSIYKPFSIFTNNFLSNFDNLLQYNLLNFFILIMLICLIITGIIFWFKKEYNFKFNWWIYITFLLIFLFLLFGCIVIDGIFGKTNLNLRLQIGNVYEKNNSIYINEENDSLYIGCQDSEGKVLVDREVYCWVFPKLKDISGTVTFSLWNGSNIEYKVYDPVHFITLSNTRRITFWIKGYNKNNESLEYFGGKDFEFLDELQDEHRNDKFLGFLFALIGVVLFSVPAMMHNLKSLTD